MLIERIFAPCGITGSEIEINKCYKKIIMPNCQWRTFNSCGDPDGDGDPEGEYVEDDWMGGIDVEAIITWLVIGAIAIGGIYVAVKVLPAVIKPRYAPPPRYAPGIEYIE